MAAPRHLKGKPQRQPFPKEASPKSVKRMSGDLIVMAALIGFSRALFGRKKQGVVKSTFHKISETLQGGGRGRGADKPAEIPVKRWKDIAWRVYEGIQNDRVLLVSAGVTFYALLA